MSKKLFEIIELEEIVLIKGYGTKDQAHKALNRYEKKEWGLNKDEQASIEMIEPIYELTTIERHDPDTYYKWKEDPFIDENGNEHRWPIGFICRY